MIRDLFVNIALLAVFVFFAGQWLLKADSDSKKWSYRLKVGAITGSFGVLLILTGVSIEGNAMLDLRYQVLYVAASLGGLPGALTALAVMMVGLSLIHPASLLPSLAAGLILALVSGIAFQRIRQDGYRLLLFTSSFLIVFLIELAGMQSISMGGAVAPYLVLNTLCTLFIAAFLAHIKRSAGLMDELRRVQRELLGLLHLQPGLTMKFHKENGKFVYTIAEGQLLTQFGFEREKLIGNDGIPGDQTPIIDRQRLYGYYERAWGGEFVTFESTLNGINALITLKPLQDANGNTIEVIASGTNITERIQAERTLVENELKYRTIVDSSEDLIFGFNEAGVITSANQKAVEQLGYSFKQMIGQPFLQLFPGKHEELWNRYFDRSLEERHRHRFELVMQLPQLNERTYSVTFSPVFGEEGTFTSMTGTIHDLTDIIKKEQADEANEAKTQFLARMSHEIRTPLSGIIGVTELMAKTELSEIQKDYTGKIEASSQALLHIINEILDFSKVEAGKLGLEPHRFHTHSLLKKLADTISIFMGKQQIEFIMDIPEELPEIVIGDAQRLEQILLNLCGNAIKFTEKGHVSLRICLLGEVKPGEPISVRFEVEDTGIGMSKEQMEHLYQPFTQADGSTSRKYGGTGLGLVISKSLIELMGGELFVSSMLGQGTRFRFELVFAVPEDLRITNWRLGARHAGRRAMVVEDCPFVYQQLHDYLTSFQLEATWVRTWKEAIALMEQANPATAYDLVLADMEMDDMYGADTWELLKTAATRTDTITIAMTSVYGRDALFSLSEIYLPEAILVKPISRNGLFETLLAALDHKSQSEETEMPHEAAELNGWKLSSGRILLAEDNAINQLVATELLKSWGYYVEVAQNGVEVLEKLEVAGWDLILMDIHMPEMDGYEATRRIRENPLYDQLPIVALTANVIQSNQDTYYRIGMNDIITKPIDVDSMRLTISKWLAADGVALYPGADAAPTQTNEEEDVAQDWSGLAGIHVPEALRRLDGKVPIFLQMLKRFRQQYAHFDEELETKLAQGELEAAKRLLHTFRGAAGNLSAHALLAAATKLELSLEQAAAAQDGSLQAKLEAMKEEMGQVMSSIMQLQGEQN